MLKNRKYAKYHPAGARIIATASRILASFIGHLLKILAMLREKPRAVDILCGIKGGGTLGCLLEDNSPKLLELL